MKSFTPTPRYDITEEAQATRIHKALEGKLGEPTADTIEKLRKESKRYAN